MRIPLLRRPGEDIRTKWWEWPFLLVLSVLFLVSAPITMPAAALYFWLYPDRHVNVWDSRGTAHQKPRLRQWRAAYARLSLRDRWQRARKLRRRRNMV